jgi:hypothetical protein
MQTLGIYLKMIYSIVILLPFEREHLKIFSKNSAAFSTFVANEIPQDCLDNSDRMGP